MPNKPTRPPDPRPTMEEIDEILNRLQSIIDRGLLKHLTLEELVELRARLTKLQRYIDN
jgi:hypothetical protein